MCVCVCLFCVSMCLCTCVCLYVAYMCVCVLVREVSSLNAIFSFRTHNTFVIHY